MLHMYIALIGAQVPQVAYGENEAYAINAKKPGLKGSLDSSS